MTVLEGFNTASGKYCCNIIYLKEIPKGSSWVSIPQAVSTVATTYKISRNIYAKLEVSIPQAVSTVATYQDCYGPDRGGFNTASGKYCCN